MTHHTAGYDTQLVIVYLGVALEDTDASTRDKVAKWVIIAISAIITIAAAWYIYYKMDKARLTLYRARRAASLEKGKSAQTIDGIPDDAMGENRFQRNFNQSEARKASASSVEPMIPLVENHRARLERAGSRDSYENSYDIV